MQAWQYGEETFGPFSENRWDNCRNQAIALKTPCSPAKGLSDGSDLIRQHDMQGQVYPHLIVSQAQLIIRAQLPSCAVSLAANQGHESASLQIRHHRLAFPFAYQLQLLSMRWTHRNDHSSAFRQLCQ